ncbi:uncharacterized protein LOC120258181 [Dioscorea cayenensis subsp. rotundata]|uniref:Uncharacterized protein LOC120258181 n=1 Tax=Dioscorea cayennensis subsp. rotundata TaxID=55577 RepID=A0AB40B438_DIOCR|nr:uncharacterized protein LOC120258181 [Dioscorea cayenensis subsp. rotundata]
MLTNGNYSPSSSPPTPPSPLPLSVGPGNRKYPFTPSPSLSPPFSPPSSQYSSPEILPLLHEDQREQRREVFCLDTLDDDNSSPSEKWQQFANRLRWLILRFCCCCCSSLY